MKERKDKQVRDIINSCYHDIFNDLKKKYHNTDEIFGIPIEDIYQTAVIQFIEWVAHRDGPKLEQKINESYIRKAIVTNFKEEICRIQKKRELKNENREQIKGTLHSFDNIHFSEEIDYEEAIDHLGSKAKAFVKLRVREGASVREVRDKLDISSMREYYDIKGNIEKLLKKYGFKEEGDYETKTRTPKS